MPKVCSVAKNWVILNPQCLLFVGPCSHIFHLLSFLRVLFSVILKLQPADQWHQNLLERLSKMQIFLALSWIRTQESAFWQHSQYSLLCIPQLESPRTALCPQRFTEHLSCPALKGISHKTSSVVTLPRQVPTLSPPAFILSWRPSRFLHWKTKSIRQGLWVPPWDLPTCLRLPTPPLPPFPVLWRKHPASAKTQTPCCRSHALGPFQVLCFCKCLPSL